jgi:hypothetical protein
VVLDPNHDFLREIPKLNWSDSESLVILRDGMNAPDRSEALRRVVQAGTPEGIKLAMDMVAADNGQQMTFRTVNQLVNIAKPEHREFWMKQLSHPNFDRRASAVQALAKLPVDAATTNKFRSMITDKDPIAVVVGCINALAAWDKKGNQDVFKTAQKINDRRGRIKRAADAALAEK